MFDVGAEYLIQTEGQTLRTTIVNAYEEEPGIWIVIVKEPQTGTLLRRRRTVKKTVPMTTHGGY